MTFVSFFVRTVVTSSKELVGYQAPGAKTKTGLDILSILFTGRNRSVRRYGTGMDSGVNPGKIYI